MSIFDQRAGTPGYESDGWQTPSLRASADRATARRQVEDQIRIQRTAQKNAKRALRKGDAQAWQFWHNAAGGRTTGINDSQQIRREAGATARIQNERADRMAQESQRIEEQALARLNRGVAPMEPSPMENRATESEFLNPDDFMDKLERSEHIRSGNQDAFAIARRKGAEMGIDSDFLEEQLTRLSSTNQDESSIETDEEVGEAEIAQSRTRDGRFDDLSERVRGIGGVMKQVEDIGRTMDISAEERREAYESIRSAQFDQQIEVSGLEFQEYKNKYENAIKAQNDFGRIHASVLGNLDVIENYFGKEIKSITQREIQTALKTIADAMGSTAKWSYVRPEVKEQYIKMRPILEHINQRSSTQEEIAQLEGLIKNRTKWSYTSESRKREVHERIDFLKSVLDRIPDLNTIVNQYEILGNRTSAFREEARKRRSNLLNVSNQILANIH